MIRPLLSLLLGAMVMDCGMAADERVEPGSTIFIDFPQLGTTWANEPARMGIYIPTDYTPDRTFPLVVWFGAGGGGDSPGTAVEIVGPSGFICVGVPYRKGWSTPWSYYEPMVRELDRVVPNINPRQRVCSGFSSGGAAIAHHMGVKDGFRDYFYAFMPGGAGWAMGSLAGLKGRPMLGFIGDQDERLKGFITLVDAAKTAGMDVKFIKYEGGHWVPIPHYPEMREWIMQKVVRRDLPQLQTAMKSELGAKRYGRAFRAANQVLAVTGKEMPAHIEAQVVIAKVKPLGEAEAKRVLTMPLADKQQFVREWRGCDFVQPVEAQCVAVADEQLQKIMAQQPVSPANLKKYISLWEGFAVVREASGHYERLAGEALEKIRQLSTPEAKNSALKPFIVDWAAASSTVYQAQQLREELAATELAAIKQIKAKGTMKAKLGDFIRSYEGTAAGSEARTLAGSR